MKRGADSTTGPCAAPSLRPLLETLEDPGAAPGALTDALLTLTGRLTGEDGKEFAGQVEKHFPQLYKIFKTHIPTENSELSSAALQALGFSVFNPKIASLLCETEIHELLSIVNSVALKAMDKNILTRALWVISKQAFPSDAVGKLVPSIITALEAIFNKDDLHSVVVEYEALNVIIRLIEQAPSHMEEQAVRWAKLIIPLVVHSAHKVQLRGATALEMGMPLLLQKQAEVAAVTEELMTTKIIPELQKLFSSKNETYVLKLWPLFVKLLGKALHRSGSFINSLLQLEELGFRSATPVVKKIAFIAWKSLIDNFALNPEILCSAKRLRLLMQPLSSIHVRTEGLALTKLEVWWYLLMRLGPQLPAHFEQVCVPLIQSTLSLDASVLQGNSPRLSSNQCLVTTSSAHKPGIFPFGTSSQKIGLNSSAGAVAVPSIQLLGIEMLLHFFMGPEVLTFAKENNIVLSLEPLQCSVITSPSFFCKHASTFISAVEDGFVAVGKDTSNVVLSAIWKEMIGFVRAAVESGSKRERQSLEVLTLLLQTLKNIIESNELPALKSLSLMDITIKELPPKILGSPAYQVANMDLLNGTPALFLIQLSFREDLLKCGIQDERFFLNYESLVGFVLSGPASPLAFTESVFVVINQSAEHLENKEHLWRIWNTIVSPLTDWINQTNEVNQGDALEHNFSAIYSALLLPVNHIFSSCEFPQPTMKTLLRSWSELYKTFARCALLVATAEDNLCCEELCTRIVSRLGDEAPINESMLEGLSYILSVMVDCINFAPFGTKFSARRSPQAPTDWSKKKRDPLGMLSSLVKLKVILISSLQRFLSEESSTEKLISDGLSVVSGLQNIISHISLPSVIRSLFGIIAKPLAEFYEKSKSINASRMSSGLNNKLDKLLTESISCLQSNYTGSFDSELLQEICPLLCIMLLNKNKQIRNQAAQFWNATFGKAVLLTYPEELKPILCQARKKILLSLPSFESTEVEGEANETCSDSLESSQWDSKISGMEVKPCGKKGFVLRQTNELKQNRIASPTANSKVKLDLSLAKSNRKNVLLEEENTVDFVFIPPEAKERVLTEHQKEVLRTKRVDIPTMYNNLDASQDTSLFSQYTQCQEDSLDKPNLNVKEGKEKENKVVSQNEGLLSIPPDVPGNDKTNILPEGSNCSRAEHLSTLVNTSLDPKHKLEMDVFETVPRETSVLDVSCSEKNSNVSSSSSASSDIISGTPQPVSRRQSFITLEKFDSSGNKLFTHSTFKVPGNSTDISFLTKQEGMSTSVAASNGKPDMENKSAYKLKNEEIVTRSKRSSLEIIDALETYDQPKKFKEIANSELQSESKRSSLKENKAEFLEENKSVITQVDQEKNMHISLTKDTEKRHKELNERQEECLLNIPSQSYSLSVNGNPAIDDKQILDTVVESKTMPNLDSKENTPPELISSGDIVCDVIQSSQALPIQKTLRRSLRRKPEATEVPSDSQDKENSQQKKDGRKDIEKSLPKKIPQIKETAGQKQKPIAEKNMDTQGGMNGSATGGGTVSKESHASGSIKEEANMEKSESSNASDTDDLQDSGLVTSDEKSKGLPRYHTRRASQGLLTSIENSESDSSEAREEGTKRKRSGRWKSKNVLGSQVKEELDSQEINSQIQATPKERVSVFSEELIKTAGYSDDNEKVNKNSLSLSECVGLKLAKDSPQYECSTDAVKNSDKILKQSFCEPPLETRQEIRSPGTDSSPFSNTLSDDAYTTAINGLSSSEEPLETPECQHKRSKRTRRSKSCDCCGERPTVHLEKFPMELKKQGTPQSKLKDHKKISSKGAIALQCTSAAVSSSPEAFKSEPCAVSTPLPCTKELPDPKDSSSHSRSEMEVLGVDTQEDKLKLTCVKNESCMTGAEALSCVDFAEVLSTNAESKPGLAEGETKAESALANQSNTDPSGELKNETNMEVESNQIEATKASEGVTIVRSTEEKKAITSVTETLEPKANKMVQDDDDAENDAAYTSTDPGILSLLPKESDSDSPLKLKELDAISLAKISESPNGVQARCVWSPSASPTTSILKRGMKRQQEEDSPSPANKSRRVSFANPIYHEEVADDIDRRSSVVRTHSSNGSPSFRSIKPSPNHQAKHITTPTKGFLSPGSGSHKYKSSKKCLITEMVKEPLLAPNESIYPALMDCKAPVDTILPQITSNIWARGLGQLIRAKNIRTVGDLSSLTAAEIKTLPIRSPKVSNVKRALKAYYEQQVKPRAPDEGAGLDDPGKSVNGTDEKSLCVNEDNIGTNLNEPVATGENEQPTIDILAQINTLASHMTSEKLLNYSGSQLLEMQDKLHNMANCITKSLQSRWKSPSWENTV